MRPRAEAARRRLHPEVRRPVILTDAVMTLIE
jgi:hypothetical protein